MSGRSVYVEDLEVAVRAATGLPAQKCAVVGMAEAGRTGVVLFVESRPGVWEQLARRALAAELGPEAEVAVVAGGRGLIKRTTSGKTRRRAMWEAYRSHQFTSTESQDARSSS